MILTADLYGELFFLFFRKTTPFDAENAKIAEEKERTAEFSRIRCPLCKWQPQKSDRWTCADCAAPEYFYGGCYTDWNTFDTRGVCPGCQHQWRWTSCLSCWQWSLHEDWYEREENG